MQVSHKKNGNHWSIHLLQFSSSQKIKLYEKSFNQRNFIFELFSAFLKIFQSFSSLSLKMSLKFAPVHNCRNNESPVASQRYFGRGQNYLEGFC